MICLFSLLELMKKDNFLLILRSKKFKISINLNKFINRYYPTMIIMWSSLVLSDKFKQAKHFY